MIVLVVLVGVMVVAASVAAMVWAAVAGSASATHGLVHGTARAVERKMRFHERFAGFVRRRTSPAEITGLALTLALLALVVVGVLGYQIRTDTVVVRFDRDVAQWAAREGTSTSADVLRVITDAGGTPFVILLAAVVAIVELRRRSTRGVILFLVVVIGGQVAATNLVKLIVGRDRPSFARLTGASGFSFPSGHSASAAACFAACALCLGRGRSARQHVVLASVAAALAFMVAGSRVLLGVHWLSDTIAGLCFGAAWFALCAIAFGGRLLRFGAPVEVAQRADAVATGSAVGGSAASVDAGDRAPSDERTDTDRDEAERRADGHVSEVVHPEQHP